jgi:hypothetical protein
VANQHQAQPRIAAIGIDLGDVWGHYCSIDHDGELIEEGRPNMTRRTLSNLLEELRARATMYYWKLLNRLLSSFDAAVSISIYDADSDAV